MYAIKPNNIITVLLYYNNVITVGGNTIVTISGITRELRANSGICFGKHRSKTN